MRCSIYTYVHKYYTQGNQQTLYNCTLNWCHSLTLGILMDFPIHIATINMGLSIWHFYRPKLEFSELWCISVPEGLF